MTETEWLGCVRTWPMSRYLIDRPCDRKLRLFAAACCRRIGHLLPAEAARMILAVTERQADGLATPEELKTAGARMNASEGRSRAEWALRSLLDRSAFGGARTVTKFAQRAVLADPDTSDAQEAAEQCRLLREVIGNPFRPVSIDPAWLTAGGGAAARLATRIYEERRFDLLPILVDALEEAGCADEGLLAHCRRPGPHVLGCRALDVLSGRG